MIETNKLCIESKRSSNDSRRTRLGDKPENSRRSCIKRQLLVRQRHLQPAGIRSLPAPLESVPIVAKSDTLKQTKSMEFIPPPPRSSFDWFMASKKPARKAAASGEIAAIKKPLSLPQQLRESNKQARCRERQRVVEEKKRARAEDRQRKKEERAVARQEAKLSRQRENEAARAANAERRTREKQERDQYDARARLALERFSALSKPRHMR